MIFLRPWFLLLILLIPVFYYFHKNNHTQNPWKKIINPEFLPFLLVNHHKLSNKKNIFVWLSILWTLLVIALAGPAFKKMPVIADKNPQGTVLIVDLNHLNKTTIPQLKIKLSETVKLLKEERIGLVLYDEKGYVALPMTEDSQIIQELIPVLNPSVLPTNGDNPTEGFKTAIELLKNNKLDNARILFFTGGTPNLKGIIPLIQKNNYSVGTLGLGTSEKTPILGRDGNFKRDTNGQIILTNVNKNELSKLGPFEIWRPDNNDIISLIKQTTSVDNKSLFGADVSSFLSVDTYKDLGVYILVCLMPFIAIIYRKGFIIFLICLFVSTSGYASPWLREDQILYNTNKKAVEAYQNKDYLSALAGFQNDSSATGLYNQANATAHMGKYQEAIDLYAQALKLNPEHKEAAFNKAYLEQLMKNKQENASQKSDQNDNQSKENKQNDSSQNMSNSDDKDQNKSALQNDVQENEDQNQPQSKENSANDSTKKQENQQDTSQETSTQENATPSQENQNEQVYPQQENDDSLKNQENANQKNTETEHLQKIGVETDEQPIDQTTQEIFNLLKKDPSLLLRYRLNEQYRRKP